MIARRAVLFAALGIAMLSASACSGVYQKTYEQETERLEREEAERAAGESARHAEAKRYVAVVYFAAGSAALDAEAERQLRWFAERMQPYPEAQFDVQGFADASGGEATNQRLSERRAAAVASYLGTLGIAAERIDAHGYASQAPVASNVSAKGRRENRRVEVSVR